MQLTTVDFLLLSLSGIDLFLEIVDQNVQSKGLPFEECARGVRNQIYEYGKSRAALDLRPTVSVKPAPLKMSLRELLDRDTCGAPAFLAVCRNVVYIIRDGKTVLYVGSTRYNARSRIKSHQKAHSPLGQALREDPNALNWNAEMIPHADYDQAAEKEKKLIRKYNPPFCRRR